MDIQTFLRERITTWGQIGHPALMERFIDRNGECYEADPFTGTRMTPNLCFQNAALFVYEHGGLYAEGYGWRQNLPLLIHHAWVVWDGRVIDPTWDQPETYQYLGVTLAPSEVAREIAKSGYYSVLDPGMINIDWMFGRDPGLRDFLP
jgi:hypothetical protein